MITQGATRAEVVHTSLTEYIDCKTMLLVVPAGVHCQAVMQYIGNGVGEIVLLHKRPRHIVSKCGVSMKSMANPGL